MKGTILNTIKTLRFERYQKVRNKRMGSVGLETTGFGAQEEGWGERVLRLR